MGRSGRPGYGSWQPEVLLMVPTMILFGLVLGRWWKTSLVLAAIAWPALLWSTGITDADVLAVALIGVLNAAFGVLVHQAVLQGFRWLRAASGDRVRA